MKPIEITDSELNSLPKEALIILYHQMCTNQTRLLEQNETLVKKIDDLTEQIAILTQNRFGKRSEAEKQIEGQMSMSDYVDNILNEAESLTQNGTPAEKDIEVVVRTHTRKAGRRKEKLSAVEKEIVMHECSEEVLDAAFPNGWHEIGEDVYSELQYTPATFKVLEHHVKSYGGNHDGDTVIRADHPERILDHSILSPELFAMIFNMKYVNAIPLNRLSEEIRRYDVILDRQDMAGWLISVYKYYMKPVHEMMKKNLMDAGLLHCDETPFVMPERSKQYMWVMHSPGKSGGPPIYLYEYLGGRNGEVIQDYLNGYKGVLVTDGYQPYHTIMKNSNDITVAGCYSHVRRKFAEIVKAVRKGEKLTPAQEIAAEAVKRIDALYHLDNKFKDSSDEERLKNRQENIRPLVDDFFAWVKTFDSQTVSSSKLRTALNYAENQEYYLRTFLDHPEVPLDNNDALSEAFTYPHLSTVRHSGIGFSKKDADNSLYLTPHLRARSSSSFHNGSSL